MNISRLGEMLDDGTARGRVERNAPSSSPQLTATTPDTRRMHVLVTVNAAWNIWNFRRPVVAALLAEGHRVTVLAPEDDHVGRLEQLGCRFIPLAMDQKGLNPLGDLALLRQLRAVFGELRPDVILSYTIKNNLYGALAARSLRLAFIPNVSGLGTAFLSGSGLRLMAQWLYRAAFRSLPVVFFQNGDDRELFLTRRLVRDQQARLLPGSGIDLEHFALAGFPAEEEPPVFLMIARLLRDKGVHEFVEAARMVRACHPDARFQLLGAVDSQNRTAVDAGTVRAWQQSHGVEYLGTSDDVRPQIAAAQCVVLPSYREGAPRTLIEAAAMGRPLIATDVPGCRQVVEHRRTGFLCQVRDAESLAEACLRFLRLSHDAKIAMGRTGREKMQREFDQAHVVAAYRQALAEAVQ